MKRGPLGAYKWVRTDEMDTSAVPDDSDYKQGTTPEYNSNTLALPDTTWSREECLYLLELCDRFEDRLLIVADQYAYEGDAGDSRQERSYSDIQQQLALLRGLKQSGPTTPTINTEQTTLEERQLLRIIHKHQPFIPRAWQSRRKMIAVNAGDTFVMNNPTLPDLLGLDTDDDGVNVDSKMELEKKTTTKTQKTNNNNNNNRKNSVKRAVDDREKRRRGRAAKQNAADADQQKGTSKKQQPATITPLIRTSMLKPVKAGLSRQVDRALQEMGLPPRPVYPSERNCEVFEEIKALLADILSTGSSNSSSRK